MSATHTKVSVSKKSRDLGQANIESDVWVGDNRCPKIDSDLESPSEDVFDYFIGETKNDFECVNHSKFCPWTLCNSI